MKIVIAPDSFKGSLTAGEVADSIEKGIKNVIDDIEIIKVPMSDGGEGTVSALVDGTCGKIVKVSVKDPLMKTIDSFYGILGDGKTAVIEMAAASGLPLVSENEKNPLVTTTYGTGQLIEHALDMGCRNIIIGLGGSATNDGGMGLLKALGVKFMDKFGEDIGQGGGSLDRLYSIDVSDIDVRLNECSIIAACDVDNTLCGINGASYVFGPQKGADSNMVKLLDENLENYAAVIKKEFGTDIMNIPGSGAAGGLGGGIVAFLHTTLKKGINIVMDVTELKQKIHGADIVVTGEGNIDFQTAFGKTAFGVASAAKENHIPVIAIAGGIGKKSDILYEKGFDAIVSIVDKPMSLQESMKNAKMLLEKSSERVMRILKLKMSLE